MFAHNEMRIKHKFYHYMDCTLIFLYSNNSIKTQTKDKNKKEKKIINAKSYI